MMVVMMVLLSALLMVFCLRFWPEGKATPIIHGAHSLAQNATCPCATAAILLVVEESLESLDAHACSKSSMPIQ